MGSNQAPCDQAAAALKLAGEVKKKRPLLLRRIQTENRAANIRYAADVCEDVPELLGGMSVLNFLSGIKGVDFEEAEGWMKSCGISPLALMRGLAPATAWLLAQELRRKVVC